MFEPKEIDFTRVDNIRAIMINEKLTKQSEFARRIHMTPENLNRILKLRHPLTEATAEQIIVSFPESKYRKEWLLGYDRFMTEAERERSKELGMRLNAPLTVLDTACQRVCAREGITPPILDSNLGEFLFLEKQLQDYAEMLVSNYLHRDRSHVWNFLDQLEEKKNRSVKSDVT